MMATSDRRWLGVLVAVWGIAAVALGLWFTGSPAEARRRRLDERRVGDLQRLASAIDLHWTRTGTLPADLAALSSQERPPATRDPVQDSAYLYRVIDERRYELCAGFERGRTDGFWTHPAGQHCFTLEARKVER